MGRSSTAGKETGDSKNNRKASRLAWYYRNRERALEANRQYRDKHRERLRQKARANQERKNAARRIWAKIPGNKEKLKAARAKWIRKNAEKHKATRQAYAKRRAKEMKEYRRKKHLKRAFGITIHDYEDLLRKQCGGCAICGKKDPTPLKVFSVDHDHATGKIRGLLCFHCNAGIGHLHDDPRLLRKAIAYLKHHADSQEKTACDASPCPGGLFG